MTTSAQIGYGTILRIGDGQTPTEAFTDIAELLEATGPNRTADVIDATHMASPGARREKIYGLLDDGQVTASLHYLPGDSSQDLLAEARENRAPVNFQLAFGATGQRASFTAIVSNLSPTAPLDQKMTMSVTLDITGEVVFEADA